MELSNNQKIIDGFAVKGYEGKGKKDYTIAIDYHKGELKVMSVSATSIKNAWKKLEEKLASAKFNAEGHIFTMFLEA